MSDSAIEFYEALVDMGIHKDKAQKAAQSIENLLEQKHKLSALEQKVDNGFAWMKWGFSILVAINLLSFSFLFKLSFLD